jgi:RND superfamily putative drug exporter
VGPPADVTRAIPTQRRKQPPAQEPPTTAIPTLGTPPDGRGRPRQQDPEATEKINTRDDEERKRRGGGVSAQDLLRREGRL